MLRDMAQLPIRGCRRNWARRATPRVIAAACSWTAAEAGETAGSRLPQA
jgi:NTP pyrophosphatase (non-canonical NTP hydrolase)